MSGIAHSLVRRAADLSQQRYNASQEHDDDQIKQIAVWGMILLWITGVLYFAIVSAISYTYGDVIATLTMIESSTATAFTVDATDDVDAPLLDQKPEAAKAVEVDLFLVKRKPVTSSMRTAVKHIKAQGGRLARFRGLHVAFIYHLALSIGTKVLTSFLGARFRPLMFVITSVILCRLHMTWTHIVISKPSQKRWFRRFPSFKAAKNIIIPTAVLAIAQQVAVFLPAVLFFTATEMWQRQSVDDFDGNSSKRLALLQLVMAGLVGIATVVLITIPAEVTLKRVQASMLPEDDEAIVPFDRTFAGKVVPEILGGSGAVGMLDAWKTFDRSARIRLIKLYGKILLVQFATTILFIIVVAGELRLIMGDDLGKAVKMGHRQLML